MHGCKYGFFEWMFYTAKTASKRAEVMRWITFHLRASTYFGGNPVNRELEISCVLTTLNPLRQSREAGWPE